MSWCAAVLLLVLAACCSSSGRGGARSIAHARGGDEWDAMAEAATSLCADFGLGDAAALGLRAALAASWADLGGAAHVLRDADALLAVAVRRAPLSEAEARCRIALVRHLVRRLGADPSTSVGGTCALEALPQWHSTGQTAPLARALVNAEAYSPDEPTPSDLVSVERQLGVACGVDAQPSHTDTMCDEGDLDDVLSWWPECDDLFFGGELEALLGQSAHPSTLLQSSVVHSSVVVDGNTDPLDTQSQANVLPVSSLSGQARDDGSMVSGGTVESRYGSVVVSQKSPRAPGRGSPPPGMDSAFTERPAANARSKSHGREDHGAPVSLSNTASVPAADERNSPLWPPREGMNDALFSDRADRETQHSAHASVSVRSDGENSGGRAATPFPCDNHSRESVGETALRKLHLDAGDDAPYSPAGLSRLLRSASSHYSVPPESRLGQSPTLHASTSATGQTGQTTRWRNPEAHAGVINALLGLGAWDAVVVLAAVPCTPHAAYVRLAGNTREPSAGGLRAAAAVLSLLPAVDLARLVRLPWVPESMMDIAASILVSRSYSYAGDVGKRLIRAAFLRNSPSVCGPDGKLRLIALLRLATSADTVVPAEVDGLVRDTAGVLAHVPRGREQLALWALVRVPPACAVSLADVLRPDTIGGAVLMAAAQTSPSATRAIIGAMAHDTLGASLSHGAAAALVLLLNADASSLPALAKQARGAPAWKSALARVFAAVRFAGFLVRQGDAHTAADLAAVALSAATAVPASIILGVLERPGAPFALFRAAAEVALVPGSPAPVCALAAEALRVRSALFFSRALALPPPLRAAVAAEYLSCHGALVRAAGQNIPPHLRAAMDALCAAAGSPLTQRLLKRPRHDK